MAGPTVPQSVSRKRPEIGGDERADTLLLLGEFSDTPTLSVAEANVLITHLAERRNGIDMPALPNSDVFSKTQRYLDMFARFKGANAVAQVSATLEQWAKEGRITQFEKAQLGTLCCDTVEEARTLVPSLEGKVSDDDLQQVLDDISKLRDFS